MKPLLAIALCAIIAGCGESTSDSDANAPSARAIAEARPQTREVHTAAPQTAPSSEKDMDDMDDLDKLAIFARERREEEFRALALRRASGKPAAFLEAAEIADNESWPAMREEFAQLTAKESGATFAQLFRAAQFIINTPDAHLDESVMQRIEELAEKRYQREDAALMRCTMNFRRSGLSVDDVATLEHLARDAMMPQVRKSAAELLDIATKLTEER